MLGLLEGLLDRILLGLLEGVMLGWLDGALDGISLGSLDGVMLLMEFHLDHLRELCLGGSMERLMEFMREEMRALEQER